MRAQAVPIQASEVCAGSTVVDFETGSTLLRTVAGMTYAFGGLNGQPDWFDGDAPPVNMSPFGGAFFEQQIMANLVGLSFSHLAVAFSPPVEAFGAYTGAIAAAPTLPHTLTIGAFDVHGTLISSEIVPLSQPGTPAAFHGLSYLPGIARVEWRGGNAGFFGVDNLTFGDSCVATALPVRGYTVLSLAIVSILVIAYRRYRQAFINTGP
jgi:hypothetical protein